MVVQPPAAGASGGRLAGPTVKRSGLRLLELIASRIASGSGDVSDLLTLLGSLIMLLVQTPQAQHGAMVIPPRVAAVVAKLYVHVVAVGASSRSLPRALNRAVASCTQIR